MLRQMGEAISRQDGLLENIHSKMCQHFECSSLPNNAQLGESSRVLPALQNVDYTAGSLETMNQSTRLVLQMAERQRCDLDCVCNCHCQKSIPSPSFLSPLLGSLFIGYIALPRFFSRCSTKTCLRSKPKGQLFYMFPRWFLDVAVYLNIEFSRPNGPELLLRCLQVRQLQTTQSYQALLKGQYAQAKTLVVIKRASVLDIDELGRSLLFVGPSRTFFPIGYIRPPSKVLSMLCAS